MALEIFPKPGRVTRLHFFQSAKPAFQRHRAWARRRRGIGHLRSDRLPGSRVRLGFGFVRHGPFPKNLLSSALETAPAKLSNLPFSAISRADLMKASIATRERVPPTLMRRTPMSVISFTVKPSVVWLSRLTGFGATA